mgnify:CR=1 FL=1
MCLGVPAQPRKRAARRATHTQGASDAAADLCLDGGVGAAGASRSTSATAAPRSLESALALGLLACAPRLAGSWCARRSPGPSPGRGEAAVAHRAESPEYPHTLDLRRIAPA